MSNNNTSSGQLESRGRIEIFLYSVPKKNHIEMVEVNTEILK